MSYESSQAEKRVRDGFHQSYEKTAVADLEFMGGFATWTKSQLHVKRSR